jgi:hypothetical protein
VIRQCGSSEVAVGPDDADYRLLLALIKKHSASMEYTTSILSKQRHYQFKSYLVRAVRGRMRHATASAFWDILRMVTAASDCYQKGTAVASGGRAGYIKSSYNLNTLEQVQYSTTVMSVKDCSC